MKHEDNGFKASDLYLTIDVTLEELYEGTCKQVTYSSYDEMGRKDRKKIRVPLLDYKNTYTFLGMGDASPFVNMMPGNVYVTLQHVPNEFFGLDDISLSKHDLCMRIPVSLYDYYYGCIKRIELPDQKKTNLQIYYDQDTAKRRKHVIYGRGLPAAVYVSSSTSSSAPCALGSENADASEREILRGDLVIYFDIHLPVISSHKLHAFMTKTFMRRVFVDGLAPFS
jgi:DnaJ-class molecular chaperone